MKTYGSKALYYFGLGIILVGLLVFSMLFAVVFQTGRISPILLVSFINTFIVIWLFVFLRKAAYVVMTNENNAIVGNVFFEKQVATDSKMEISKLYYSSNMYRIRIDHRNYYFMTL